jgi:hypothetical protein
MALPVLLTVLIRGRNSTYRSALAETGKIAAVSVPLAMAAHMATAYLTQYLLTFGGPMPDLPWGMYVLWSLVTCVAGGAVTVPLLTALRKRPLLCGLLAVLLLVGAVTASILLPFPMGRY